MGQQCAHHARDLQREWARGLEGFAERTEELGTLKGEWSYDLYLQSLHSESYHRRLNSLRPVRAMWHIPNVTENDREGGREKNGREGKKGHMLNVG